ncbi:MAG TPA: hypothetical protein VFN10_14325 [Thermoanaerobaculia bacterium]|nr:hypothetical protein [Thermoanaerobaculia bacterium]
MLRKLIVLAVLLAPCAAYARGRAVFVYPRERALFHRLFYTSHQRALRSSVATHYHVEVHEQIASDDALFAIDVRGANLLVLSGHGDPFSIYFADRKQRTLDATDRANLERFFAQLAPDATIVLQSCYTGRGFAHLVKDAAGPRRVVIAAKGEIPRDGVSITSIEPFDARITCDDGGHAWDCTLRLR